VVLVGISLVPFVVTGGLRGRARRKQAKAEPDSQPPATRALGAVPPSAGMASRPKAAPVPAKRKGAPADDEDFGEVAAILKRHGIS
jgi:hypothetical protein